LGQGVCLQRGSCKWGPQVCQHGSCVGAPCLGALRAVVRQQTAGIRGGQRANRLNVLWKMGPGPAVHWHIINGPCEGMLLGLVWPCIWLRTRAWSHRNTLACVWPLGARQLVRRAQPLHQCAARRPYVWGLAAAVARRDPARRSPVRPGTATELFASRACQT
jgi:hypothetical protein